jgi:hypothetical protein
MGEHEKPEPTGKYPDQTIIVEPGVTYGPFPEPTGEYPPSAVMGLRWHEGVGSVNQHAPDGVLSTDQLMAERTPREAAYKFLSSCGLEPTPDAVGQLVEAFLPCLSKMCDPEHPWDPNGGTWRESGTMGALTDIRKKFKRFWYRAWIMRAPHNDPAAVDSAIDGINFFGFWLRSSDDGWNEWGEPGSGEIDV